MTDDFKMTAALSVAGFLTYAWVCTMIDLYYAVAI